MTEGPKTARKYQQELNHPALIELTDPPPAESYKIELTGK
jgi:hypothetical protein